MSTEKVRLWFVRETDKAYQYSKLPPDRLRSEDDYVWIPKSQVEHRSKEPSGLHILTLPEWLIDAKNLLLVVTLSLLVSCGTSQKPKPTVVLTPEQSSKKIPPISQAPYSLSPLRPFETTRIVPSPPPLQTNVYILRWVYPTNLVNTYWWDLYASSNLTHWTVIQSNCGPGDVTVTITNNFQFFRMRGRP